MTKTDNSFLITQARLAAIVESSDDAIISKDLNGIVTSWNRGAEMIFGYKAEEVIGGSITIIIPTERLAEEPDILTRIRAGERIDHYETVRQRKDGTLIDISLTVSPIFDGEGRVVGASKIARDITASKEIERVRAEADTMRRIVDAQESERRRIARDLHDHVGQEVTAMRLQMQAMLEQFRDQPKVVDAIEKLRELAEKVDWDLGFLSWELRPTELETLGIADALKSFVLEWSRQHRITATCDCSVKNDGSVVEQLSTNIYRIVQEALNNVAKHSGAKNVYVLFRKRGANRLELIIEDDGSGFDISSNGHSKFSGFGLTGMQERAALFGGKLEIESTPGQGTALCFEFPIGKR